MTAKEPCKYNIDTKYGELFIVDDAMYYTEAERYCARLGARLPALHNETMITDISTYLSDCREDAGYHGISFERERGYHSWTVGLTIRKGVPLWSDGQAYVESQHGALLKNNLKPDSSDKNCESGYLNYFYSLSSESCTQPSSFLCLRNSNANYRNDESPSIPAVTLATDTATAANMKICEEQNRLSQFITIGLSMLFGILIIGIFIYTAIKVIKRRRNQQIVRSQEMEMHGVQGNTQVGEQPASGSRAYDKVPTSGVENDGMTSF